MSKKKQTRQTSKQTEQQRLDKKHAYIRRKWRNAVLAVCGAGLIAAAGFGISKAGSIRSGDLHGAVTAETSHYQVNAAMLAYYYQEHIDSYLEYVSANPGMPVFDAALPLEQQYYDDAQTKTWREFFMESTLSTVSQTLQACEAAYEAGYTLPAETLEQIKTDAAATDLSRYQSGVTEADVAAVMELQMIGRRYQQDAYAAVSVPEEALAPELEANRENYVRFGLSTFTFTWETLDDPQKAVGEAHAEEMSHCTTYADFTAYAKNYMEEEDDLTPEIIAQRLRAMDLMVGYSSCSDDIKAWVQTAKVGDTYIYEPEGALFAEVLMLTSLPAPDEGECVDMRVIYLPSSLHGGNLDETLATAQTIIESCKEAGSTSASFAQLAAQYSADSTTASNGGLIEGYSCNRTDYGTETAEWAFAAGRAQGDMFICERENAAVVAFYEGKNALCGWQNQVRAKLTQEQYSELTAAMTACEVSMHEENQDLVRGQLSAARS